MRVITTARQNSPRIRKAAKKMTPVTIIGMTTYAMLIRLIQIGVFSYDMGGVYHGDQA